MRILLFWDLSYEFNAHTHAWTIPSAIDFELDARISRFSQELTLHVTDANTHTWKMFLVNDFEFNTNTHTSKIHQEFEMYRHPQKLEGAQTVKCKPWPQLGPFFVPACPPSTAINGY